MNGTDQIMRQYEALGISKEVYAFGSKVEESLKERFLQVDKTAEFNQLKVLGAMQRQKDEQIGIGIVGLTATVYQSHGRIGATGVHHRHIGETPLYLIAHRQSHAQGYVFLPAPGIIGPRIPPAVSGIDHHFTYGLSAYPIRHDAQEGRHSPKQEHD